MKIWKLTQETCEMREELAEEFNNMRYASSIDFIARSIGDLYRGSLYVFCACRGVGKTTILLASAVAAAEEGKKVLFLTVEQSYVQLMPYLPLVDDNLIVVEESEQINLKELDKIIKEENIEEVYFDYIGAASNVGNWDELVYEAAALAELAKSNSIVIWAACQADDNLLKTYKDDPNNLLLNTGYFVSFSKHITDKIAGGVYLIRDEGRLVGYNYKNRYNALNTTPVKTRALDWGIKRWNR